MLSAKHIEAAFGWRKQLQKFKLRHYPATPLSPFFNRRILVAFLIPVCC